MLQINDLSPRIAILIFVEHILSSNHIFPFKYRTKEGKSPIKKSWGNITQYFNISDDPVLAVK